MRAASFAEIQAEFLERVQQFVYCNMATIAPNNRPRSRIVHLVWGDDDMAGYCLCRIPLKPNISATTRMCP
jgi:hypothetical protein